MARESIYLQRRPGFPREAVNDKSYQTTIEYVGLIADLIAASPLISTPWGEYQGIVSSVTPEHWEGSDYGVLTVVCERLFDAAGQPTGTVRETSYEVDWVDVERSLFEHPKFRVGGGGTYELTEEDVAAIRSWEKCPDPHYKAAFSYSVDDWKTSPPSSPTLSANAKMLAAGLAQGIESWVDKLPVLRMSKTYVGGPPPQASAGQKESPPSTFPNKPSGYEWIRSADRGLRSGGQTKWVNDTEWIGCKKVLIDVDEVFWTAPS